MTDDQIENEIQAKALIAPRVTKADLDANISSTEIVKHVSTSGQVLRWAVITTVSGFSVAGKPSCAASSANDDAELGEKLAIDNARNELWPLMGYALKERLAAVPADFRDRVRAEANELSDRRDKLVSFLSSSTFEALPIEEQSRLREQHAAMCDYCNVLYRRIAAFAA